MYRVAICGPNNCKSQKKSVIDSMNERFEIQNLSEEEKINLIKLRFNLTHGKGKRKRKRGKK